MLTQEYNKWWLGLLILLYLVSIFAPLNILPLSFEEPRRGVVALEMIISGNYIVPTINGELYLNKPPIHNWSIQVNRQLRGMGGEATYSFVFSGHRIA